jgi:hypothetical protein
MLKTVIKKILWNFWFNILGRVSFDGSDGIQQTNIFFMDGMYIVDLVLT